MNPVDPHKHHSENADSGVDIQDGKLSRRKLLLSLGMTGAAAVTGFGLLGNKSFGMSTVTNAVYENPGPNPDPRIDTIMRKQANLWIDLEEDFPVIPPESDDTGRFLRAIAHIETSGTNNRKLYLTKPDYVISSTIHIRKRGVQIIGLRHGRPTDPSGKTEGGTRINYAGTGACFELGEPATGFADTVQGFTLDHITLTSTGSTRVSLNNPMAVSTGRGNYGAGTYGVKDNNNGNVEFRNVQIERFEYGFWGMYSDVNTFDLVNLFYNKVGMFLGLACSQNTLRELYTIGNDTALWIKGASGLRVQDCQFVKDGSGSTAPIIIEDHHSPYDSVYFHRCWFEVGSSHRLDSFVQISCGANAEPSKSIIFRDSCMAIGAKVNGEPVCKYFVRIGNASQILIDEVTAFPHNLKKLVAFEGSYTRQRATFRGCVDWDYGDGLMADKLGTGEAKMITETYTNEGVVFGESVTIKKPSFVHAYADVSQFVSAGVLTKIAFPSIKLDNIGEFDLISSSFKAKTSGIYLVTVCATWSQPVLANRIKMSIHIGNSSTPLAYIDDALAEFISSKGSFPVKLNNGETFDIRVWTEHDAAIQAGMPNTYLCIVKLS
ncbi:hypothetical protein GCM10023310_10430 [Paenibacillus vulneris]|uniref:Right handed beta helix domain-containing protein n=1 Tax=Paenibacillus vulneris TaxID=1133364 RepID=A0ABW3UDN5_9BACL